MRLMINYPRAREGVPALLVSPPVCVLSISSLDKNYMRPANTESEDNQ